MGGSDPRSLGRENQVRFTIRRREFHKRERRGSQTLRERSLKGINRVRVVSPELIYNEKISLEETEDVDFRVGWGRGQESG